MTPTALRHVMKRLGLETQRSFADLLCVSEYYLSQMLRNEKPISATVEASVNALLDAAKDDGNE